MIETISKILRGMSTVLVVIVVILAVLLAGVRVAGLDVFVVLSGSMEPEYPVGALLYVNEADTSQLAEQDVITFQLADDVVATHRIIELVPDENDPSIIRYRTKGDANEAEDGSLVEASQIIGTPIFTIPYLGYLAMFIQTAKGKYVAIAVCAALLLIVVLTELLISEAGNNKKKKEGEAVETGEQN